MNLALLVAYLLAITIPILAIMLIHALDLFGTGKGSMIISCMIWGTLGAFGLAYSINTTAASFIGDQAVIRLFAPVIEEILKALILIYFVRQPRFRYIVDGAIYGFTVGIAFSVSENLLYIATYPDTALTLAISRIRSASLTHAAASAIVGISLGQIRRAASNAKIGWSFIGIGIAILLHIVFNTAVNTLHETTLLLVAFAFGCGSSALIAFLIHQGLEEEKRRFSETLGLNVGVSAAERQAVQQLGGNVIEDILAELAEYFGRDKVILIRRLLAVQANIGILQNNLQEQASERLREAWQAEIVSLRQEANTIRNQLGIYVMSFLRGVFPVENDDATAKTFNREIAQSDPTLVHTFDLFVEASKAAGTFTPEQLSRTAEMLQSIEIFKDIALADLENLSRVVSVRTFEDGDILFDQGDEGDAMYLIQRGRIGIYNKVGKENYKLLRTLEEGDVVGELALLDGYPRSARVCADGFTSTLVLRREHFMMFVQSRPQVILVVLKFLAQRVRYTVEIVQTSMTWASEIAQGNYDAARHLPAVNETEDMPLIEPAITPMVDMESERVSQESSVKLQGIFARAALALQEREAANKSDHE